MAVTVQFRNVSKKYRLGLSRTSIPEIIKSWTTDLIINRGVKKQEDLTHWAVHDISFDLKKGDALALVGANGAGKTTILKLIAQITRPTAGEIKVNGRLSALIELGAGFHPDLSGRENIYLNGSILGMKKKEVLQRFDQIVAFSELERFINTPIKRYSSGMVVRLGFAIAAAIEPNVLLVDEVLAVGDTSFRLKCMNRINELIENGTSVIFVSHNMGLVKALCNVALYIDKGVAKEFGGTNEIIESYNRDQNKRRMESYQNSKSNSHNALIGTAEIVRVTVESQDAADEDIYKADRPAKVTIQYLAHHDIDQAAIELRITRSDGTNCVTIYSKSDQFEVSLPQGRGEITVNLNPLQLYPGTYFVTVALKNKQETISYDVAYSDWFHVESGVIGYEDLDAIFEPNRTWGHLTFNALFPGGRSA